MGKWEKVRLGELTKIRTGKLDANANDENGRFPFFTCAVTPLRIDSYSYDCECVLVAGNGDLNVKYYKGKFDAYQRTYIIESLSNDRLYLPYLYRFLQMYITVLRTQTSGGVIKYIRLNSLTDAKLPFPPVHKQKRIAKNLDLASEVVKGYKDQLAELDKLVQSVFYEMFGDPVTNEKGWAKGTIRDVVREVKYGTSRPATKGGKYNYLRMNNITSSGHLDLSNLKQIDIPDNELEKCMVTYGDVLFNRTNSKELVGKTCVYNLQTRMVIAGYIIRVRVNEKMIPEFLSAILNSKYGKNTLYGMCKSIIGQANINAQELQSIKIYIPPIQLQTRFASIVTEIEAQKVQIQQALTEAENLFNSLMQEYFE